MSDNVIRKYTYLKVPYPMRPKAEWDTGDLKVGIFPYYVIRRGVTILLFGSLIKKETLHRIQYTFIMSDKNGYNNGMFVVATTRYVTVSVTRLSCFVDSLGPFVLLTCYHGGRFCRTDIVEDHKRLITINN